MNSLDPPVVIMLEDEILPEKYENKEVLWIYEIVSFRIYGFWNDYTATGDSRESISVFIRFYLVNFRMVSKKF